jgi:hypothetical protein
MSLEQVVFDALAPLVGNRVHANVFPQKPDVPITPAIVFTFISPEIFPDVCGDGGDDVANTRIQVDVYSTTFDATRALRLQVLSAMAALLPPVLWAGGFSSYEPELKLHRESMDFIHYPSSQ